MSHLFSPFKTGGLTLKNRLVMSPMCQYSAVDGVANDWHLVHCGSRAVGGVGALLMEATAVSPEGRISPDDLGLWNDAQIEPLRRITDFVAAQDCVPGVQLAHAGRKASTTSEWRGGGGTLSHCAGGWTPVAPSAIPFDEDSPMPDALDRDGIKKVVADFRAAARRADLAGFKILEIHAAHGYLLHQFLSPLSNHRTDGYGGSLEHRMRLLVEVVEAVREVWPEENPLWVRISATDWVPGGWDEAQSIALSKVLKKHGVDLMDVSSGAMVPHAKMPIAPGYQVPFAEKIRAEAQIATGAVGLITNAAQAEEILKKGQADLIFMGRELLRDPYFALHAGTQTHVHVPWPVQYERARPKA